MYVSEVFRDMQYTLQDPHKDCLTIHSGSWMGEQIGFSKDLFSGVLYLDVDTVYVSYIRSIQKRQGNVKQFYQSILDQGYKLIVVDPCPEMTCLCESMGMEYRYDYLHPYEECKEYFWSRP